MFRKYLKHANICLLSALLVVFSRAQIHSENSDHPQAEFQSNLINIRNINGKFYAYIVLLFNENPHFVNLIQEDSISVEEMQKEGFHLSDYRNYLNSIKDPGLKKLAEQTLDIYVNPGNFDEKELQSFESVLAKRNIILRFSRDGSQKNGRVILDYCIYGKKKLIKTVHPFFTIKEKIYNIQPLIYYDEFSTSNSTFYFDMIYINPEEVQNDYIIASKVINNKKVDTMFFVGAKVTEDIQFCLRRAFENSKSIRHEIWRMFEVHEITHKILNNHYNYFDQVTGEELALSSTIYTNAYLGLSVLYSYLDYNPTNPHRLAAANFIKYAADTLQRAELNDSPSLIRTIPPADIERIARDHFKSKMKSLSKN
jgi:hypothetical protein